ncbi:hypothetical protein FOQG_08531 [Fusarium oxysporum f. sp. raphani 54005]|jgi:hypothetical protein|uniref:Uncharacterized protein n=4 Tax=Fusarium oxysporum TaxID=5507 RepID=X0D0C2_FUSOX|nr:hypothetical protein FOVG_01033 [Fusarium oxysporum f. sp. pisi HDV247]EXK88137.1 hypothetical protein FOQG_08531 [Fusarium oxysporum f. sp. raphani 54005]EXL74977.1 hypothetical protein FOPG_09937 [Fusarium oxysporum f. sp. conglutinans race 2 54008]EXM24130.1 hypothetical protein FOTG_08639 [Fusarium oxysporum f. sp. vasinfectum 25433]KAI8418658.1 hypothetical protein FOFC_01228 [Fusarium oxysporum]
MLCCVPDWATIAQLEEVEIAMDWMGAKSTNCMTEAKQLNPEPKLEAVQCHIKKVSEPKSLFDSCLKDVRLWMDYVAVHSKTNDESFSSSMTESQRRALLSLSDLVSLDL